MGYRRIIMKIFSETHLHQFYSNLYDMNRNQMERKPPKNQNWTLQGRFLVKSTKIAQK